MPWDGKKLPDALAAAATVAAGNAANGAKNNAYLTYLRDQVGTNFLLKLVRNDVVVWQATASGSLTVSGSRFVLPTSATQTSISNADIDTGEWILRIENASDSTKYIATAVTASGGSGPFRLSADLTAGGSLTLGSLVLNSPSFDTAAPPVSSSTKRWHPGHYMQCTDNVNRSGIATSKRSLVSANSNFVGYQVSVWWGQTELTQGNYAALYTQLDAIRAAAQADGKKIWLRLYERSFHGPTGRPAAIPQYIVDAGGTYAYTAAGENFYGPRLWDSFVGERFLLWAEKCAEYCAANPEFAIVGSEEYTMSGAWTQPGYTAQAFVNLWQNFAQRMTAKAGTCLVHVNTGWSVYYPNNYALDKPITDALLTHKVLLGPTDLRKDGNAGSATLGTSFGSYMFNATNHPTAPGYQGVAGFAISYEWPDYSSVESPSEHLRWAVDDLGIHFIAWDPDKTSGSGTSGDWTWSQALAAVNAASGRYPAGVPSSYTAVAAYPGVADSRRFAWIDPANTWANTPALVGPGSSFPYMQINNTWTNPRPITEFPEPGVLAASRDTNNPAPAGEYTIARVASPTNAAKMAILHRIDPRYLAYGSTERSQILTYPVLDGVTYWAAFSIRMGADCAVATPTAPGEGLNIFDVHTSGTSSPYHRQPIETFWSGGNRFRTVHFGQYTEGAANVSTTSWTSDPVATEVWHHFVYQFRLGPSWASNPFVKVWFATGSGALVQVVDRSDLMLGYWHMTPNACFPKYGPYRWELDARRTMHTTGLYIFRDGAGTPTINQNAMHSLLLDRQ